ncbi:spermatogenesis-associated protein 17-like [Venturia canescens]|uniref:spermatogenesis-associated protein 17-like n=1 Tax=Venturia canescens TaxID=32260 RepID=UPI001C9D2548|nr:spermatogenesis-associated protein 17-like [Venturia canescens]
MAVVIQRHWRGFRARISAKIILIRRVEAMWQCYYDKSATKIQRAWRQHRARVTGSRAKSTKNWMANVHDKNEETVQRLRSFRKAELKHVEDEIERESLLWILFILFKLHHLLGTKSCPGVLKSVDEKHRTKIEKMIKCLEYSVYVEKKRLGKVHHIDENNCDEFTLMHGTRFERCEKAIRDYEKISQRGSTKRTNS